MEIIIPAAVALLAQYLKSYVNNQYATLGIVLVLSLIAAVVYVNLVDAGYWTSVLNILAYAGAIYTFIIARFETPTS